MFCFRKSNLKIITLTTLGITLFVLIFAFFVRYNSRKNNAATYYLKAIEQLEHSHEIQDILANERYQDERIEEIVSSNKASLTAFRKGVSLNKCDFDFGREYKNIFDREWPNLFQGIAVSKLIVLRGKYHESKGEFDDALEDYLSLLTFSYHISQYSDLMAKIIVLSIEKGFFAALRECLDSHDLSEEECRRIFVALGDYESKRFSVEQVIEAEKEHYLSTIQIIIGQVKKGTWWVPVPGVRNRVKVFINEILNQSQYLADLYFGYLLAAVQNNNEGDWITAINYFEEMEEKLSSASESDLENFKDKLEKEFLPGDIEKFSEEYAERLSETMLLIAVSPSSFRKFSDKYAKNLKELREIKEIAEKKLK